MNVYVNDRPVESLFRSQLNEMLRIPDSLRQNPRMLSQSIQLVVIRMLETQIRSGGQPTMRIPPVIELTGMFGCSERVVMEALIALRKKGYPCIIMGIDCPIIIQATSNKRYRLRTFAL